MINGINVSDFANDNNGISDINEINAINVSSIEYPVSGRTTAGVNS